MIPAIIERCAGIDVGKKFLAVCVMTGPAWKTFMEGGKTKLTWTCVAGTRLRDDAAPVLLEAPAPYGF
jgi:hypothetical protein